MGTILRSSTCWGGVHLEIFGSRNLLTLRVGSTIVSTRRLTEEYLECPLLHRQICALYSMCLELFRKIQLRYKIRWHRAAFFLLLPSTTGYKTTSISFRRTALRSSIMLCR